MGLFLPPLLPLSRLFLRRQRLESESSWTVTQTTGGRSAALDLRNKVHHFVLSRSTTKGSQPQPTNVEIIAFSFLNLRGLSNFLGHSVDLQSFAQGFNSSPYAFSMSDVGSLPQAADEAIKSHLPFLLSSCTYVLLGGTHDGGYSQTLLRLDPLVLREKVLLLRTTSFCAERILELGLEEIRFEGLFQGRDPTQKGRPANVGGGGGANGYSSSIYQASSKPPHPSTTSSPVKPSQTRPESPTKKPSFPNGVSKPFTAPAPFQNLLDRLGPTPPVVPSSSSLPPRNPPTRSASISSCSSTTSSLHPAATTRALVPAPSALAPPPTTSLSTLPIDFTPLLSTLEHYLSFKSQPQPSYADVGQNLKSRFPNALGEVSRQRRGGDKVTFGEFCKEAERRGLVRLGRRDKIGSEWIELVRGGGGGGTNDGTSNVVPPRIANKPEPPVSTMTIPSTLGGSPDFRPLVSLLLSYLDHSTPQPRPLRAIIGEKLSRVKPSPPFPPRPGEFRSYYEEAIKRGIVRVGKGEVMGAEWIELVIGKEDAKRMVQNYSMLTTQAPARAVTVDPRFYPLVTTLQQLFPSNPEPEWTQIGTYLNKYKPHPYGQSQEGGMKRYLEEAQRNGIVETGKVVGKEHGYWIRLNAASRNFKPEGPTRQPTSTTAVATLPPPTSTATAIPPQYLPLITAITDSPFTQPFCSQIAATLSQHRPRLFERGQWADYVKGAERLGIVRTGTKGQGQEWVEVVKRVEPRASASTDPRPPSVIAPVSDRTESPPSTASREVSSNSRPFDSSSVTIPPAVLQLWNSQYSLHPYSPLLLTLDFLESSTPHRKPAPSVLRAYMASLPIGLEGAFERARVLRGEGDDAGQVFARYLIGATVEGILEFEGSGVKLKRDYKGWKGR